MSAAFFQVGDVLGAIFEAKFDEVGVPIRVGGSHFLQYLDGLLVFGVSGGAVFRRLVLFGVAHQFPDSDGFVGEVLGGAARWKRQRDGDSEGQPEKTEPIHLR
jgi:hypothetical protein